MLTTPVSARVRIGKYQYVLSYKEESAGARPMSSSSRYERAALSQHQRAISGSSDSRSAAAKLRRLASLSVLEAASRSRAKPAIASNSNDDDDNGGIGHGGSGGSSKGYTDVAGGEQLTPSLRSTGSTAAENTGVDEDERRVARERALMARERVLRGGNSGYMKSALRVLVKETVEKAATPLSLRQRS